MKANIFAETQNVRRFEAAMARLLATPEDMARMALLFSPPGYGKTDTIARYCVTKGGIHVTAIKVMTPLWFLRTLVREMGEEPASRTEAVYERAAALLAERGEPLIIDEADYLIKQETHEVIRAIHDLTRVPVVFVGMDQADNKFKRFKHVYDRFTEIIKFEPLNEKDVASVAGQICEVSLADDAVQYITRATSGNFRKVKKMYRFAERIAKSNGLKEVTAAELGGRK